jgi:flavin reductase (DIM6/NTAB) family NADH-FMN oxidoreductase RutF
MDISTKPPTLAQALAALGCSHRASKWQGKRDVYRGEALVGAMNSKEGWAFVYRLRKELKGSDQNFKQGSLFPNDGD